jgi:hypothetical protein
MSTTVKLYDLGLNNEGQRLAGRVVTKGGTYGLNNCLEHGIDEPMVEFWWPSVNRENFPEAYIDEDASFISRYYLTTLTGECRYSSGRSMTDGLCLDGGSMLCAEGVQVETICKQAIQAVQS